MVSQGTFSLINSKFGAILLNVEEWQKAQTARAFKEHYFASTMGPQDEIGPALCNYHLWWRKLLRAIDPTGVSPEGGALV